MIIVSGKRAEVGQDPLAQASTSRWQGSTSGQSSTSSPDPESPSTSDSIKSNQLPSSASGELGRPPYTAGGAELPWYSSDGTLVTPGSGRVLPGTKSKLTSQPGTSMRTRTYSFAPGHGTATPSELPGEITSASSSEALPPLEETTPVASSRPPYTPGGAELPWYSSDGTLVTPGSGRVQSGTKSKLTSKPGTSVRTSTYSFAPGHWLPNTKIGTAGEIAPASSSRPPYASGGTELPWYSSDDKVLHWLTPGGVKLDQPGTTKKLPPATSVRTKTYPFVATTEIETASESPSSGEIIPTSPAQKQLKPQSKSFFSSLANKSRVFLSNLASKSKSLLSNLASKSKSLFDELNHPKLQIY